MEGLAPPLVVVVVMPLMEGMAGGECGDAVWWRVWLVEGLAPPLVE